MQATSRPVLSPVRRAAVLLRGTAAEGLLFPLAWRLLVLALLSPVVALIARGLLA